MDHPSTADRLHASDSLSTHHALHHTTKELHRARRWTTTGLCPSYWAVSNPNFPPFWLEFLNDDCARIEETSRKHPASLDVRVSIIAASLLIHLMRCLKSTNCACLTARGAGLRALMHAHAYMTACACSFSLRACLNFPVLCICACECVFACALRNACGSLRHNVRECLCIVVCLRLSHHRCACFISYLLASADCIEMRLPTSSYLDSPSALTLGHSGICSPLLCRPSLMDSNGL